MTFDEALHELAIDATTSPEEARRAYLRLLRNRKPDVDPEGFRRLREAYEIVRAGPLGTLLEEAASVRDAPAANATGDRAGGGVETARPFDAAALLTLVEERKVSEAARTLSAAFEDGAQSFASREALVPLALDVILMLEGEAAGDRSRALRWSLHAYLSETESEASAIRGAYVAKWAVVRELDELPREFPQELRSAFARAALAGEPSRVAETVFAFRLADPQTAHAAAGALRERAPLLWRWYAPTLSPGGGGARPSWAQRAGSWGFAILAIAALRFVIGEISTPSGPTRPLATPATTASSRRTSDDQTDAFAQQALRSLVAGDCTTARAMLQTLEGIRDRATDAAKERTASIVARVRAECPDSRDGGAR